MSPTDAGLMSIAMVGGLFVSSIVSGRIITDTGRWKRWLVGGMVLVVVGLGLLATIDETTPLVVVGAFMAVLGVGLGATMQNLVLAVQNNAAQADMGAASSVVAFFRSHGRLDRRLGARARCSATRSPARSTDGLARPRGHADRPSAEQPLQSRTSRGASRLGRGDLSSTRSATSIGHIFLVALPFALAGAGLRAVHPRGAAAHHATVERRAPRSRRPR